MPTAAVTPRSAVVSLEGVTRQQADEILAIAETALLPLRRTVAQLGSSLDSFEDRLNGYETAARGTDRSLTALWQNLPEGDLEQAFESLKAEFQTLR